MAIPATGLPLVLGRRWLRAKLARLSSSGRRGHHYLRAASLVQLQPVHRDGLQLPPDEDVEALGPPSPDHVGSVVWRRQGVGHVAPPHVHVSCSL